MGEIAQGAGGSVMTTLRDQCQGRWRDILPAVGVDSRFLSGRHGPCPMCGGKDRFRFDDRDGRGTWICNSCGAGDGIALAMRINKWDFKEAAARLEDLAGKAPRRAVSRERDQQALRESMNRLWRSGQPVRYGDPVARYLDARGIRLDIFPACLRYVERCRFSEGVYYPAMAAKITAPDGRPSTIHRTFLKPDGGRERKLMPGRVEKGSAIRLAPAAPVMGIAEGIETALSASIIWSMPVWAAYSAQNLVEWEPPEGASEVYIFADNDSDRQFTGQAAAYALAGRLSVRGIRVRVEVPIDAGMDWNDVLMSEMAAA